MPLGLKQLAQPIQGLEAILVTTSQDDLMFDAWSRDDRIPTNEDAAGYLGLFVRTRKEVLDAFGFKRAPIRASIETDDRIILFRHADDEYLIVTIFHASLPFGIARIQADDLQRHIIQKLTGADRVELPSFESDISPKKHPTDQPKNEDERTPVAHHPDTISTPDDDELRIPMPDVDSVEPAPLNEGLLFESMLPHDALNTDEHEADDNIAFTIGNIELEHFEADAIATPHAAALQAANGIPPSQPQGAPPMSTHEIVIQQTATQILSQAQDTRVILQQKSQLLDDATIAQMRMTNEGGRPDAKPCDTPTERERRNSTNSPARMTNEGGRPDPTPCDTPTERERRSGVDPVSRMANEGGPVPTQPGDTATEKEHPTHLHNVPNPIARIADNDSYIPPHPTDQLTAHDESSHEEGRVTHAPIEPTPTRVQTSVQNESTSPISRWDNEGGGIALQPFDTPTERPNSPTHAHAPVQSHKTSERVQDHPTTPASHDIVASMRASKSEDRHAHITDVIDYVTKHVPNPNTAHARLAIHARVPLELVHSPQRLNPEQMTQLEEAAKIMLGVEELPL